MTHREGWYTARNAKEAQRIANDLMADGYYVWVAHGWHAFWYIEARKRENIEEATNVVS
jgi:hypothetical protein